MKIVTANHFLISSWSGGTTTQLIIFPEGASLSERNFDWRISSAVVETEESDFTVFDGYERILIPLEGSLEMEHQTENGILNQSVNTFELARFKGSWKTHGKGKLTDFNLIFKPVYAPVVSVQIWEAGKQVQWEPDVTAVYLHQGILESEGQRIDASAVLLPNGQSDSICLTLERARVIIIRMLRSE